MVGQVYSTVKFIFYIDSKGPQSVFKVHYKIKIFFFNLVSLKWKSERILQSLTLSELSKHGPGPRVRGWKLSYLPSKE